MRDLALGRAYSLCNTLACEACGLLFLDMRFDERRWPRSMPTIVVHLPSGTRALRARLQATATTSFVERKPYIPAVETILGHVVASPQVLDWGGDTGLNTPFKERARVHHIYDISDKPVIAGADESDLEQARREPTT